jgi:hypothetical protein
MAWHGMAGKPKSTFSTSTWKERKKEKEKGRVSGKKRV